MKLFNSILASTLLTITSYAELTVFAAASMTGVMRELAAAFEKQEDETVYLNMASSGTLARQIDAGAPTDVFISANNQWMDWLEQQAGINPAHRFNLAGNSLVLATLPDSDLQFEQCMKGRISVGDFKSVPAGMYAKEALYHLGWLNDWQPRLIMTSNVRTALLYIQRGEVDGGIVYATDAKAGELKIIGMFPPTSHHPIIYPAAAFSDNESAITFLSFLKSDKARAVLKHHGFMDIPTP